MLSEVSHTTSKQRQMFKVEVDNRHPSIQSTAALAAGNVEERDVSEVFSLASI